MEWWTLLQPPSTQGNQACMAEPSTNSRVQGSNVPRLLIPILLPLLREPFAEQRIPSFYFCFSTDKPLSSRASSPLDSAQLPLGIWLKVWTPTSFSSLYEARLCTSVTCDHKWLKTFLVLNSKSGWGGVNLWRRPR